MTGSDRTYEAIDFGKGAEGAARKARGEMLLDKPVTAELGSVAPAIIVPGPWSDQDLRYQAEQVVSHLCDSGSYSCSRTRVIVQHAQWPHREAFLERIRDVLATIPARPAFYPGAADSYDRFLAAHPHAERYSARDSLVTGTGRNLEWAFIPALSPDAVDEICFTTESFCPVLAETALVADSPAEFVERACEFANTRLWGTLSAALVVHPDSLRDSAVRASVDGALERLHHGMIAVNCLPGLGYAIGTLPWGSFPGNDPSDIQSGTGFTNNTFLLEGVEKVVLRAPFRARPKPIWFPSRRASFAPAARRVVEYEASPSFGRLAALAWTAMG
jgi:acyl-CoA reductase-like NAD-dependent aldehyde dehydrogenase